jgi:hypothetical protein
MEMWRMIRRGFIPVVKIGRLTRIRPEAPVAFVDTFEAGREVRGDHRGRRGHPARGTDRRRGMGRRANREGTVDAFRNGYCGRIEIEGTRRTVYGKTPAEVLKKMRELRRSAEQGVALQTNVEQLTVLEALEMLPQANPNLLPTADAAALRPAHGPHPPGDRGDAAAKGHR